MRIQKKISGAEKSSKSGRKSGAKATGKVGEVEEKVAFHSTDEDLERQEEGDDLRNEEGPPTHDFHLKQVEDG